MEDTTQMAKMLYEIPAQGRPESLSQMEQSTRETLLEVGRQALEMWARSLEERYPAASIACGCGQEALHRSNTLFQTAAVASRIVCKWHPHPKPESDPQSG